MHVFYEYLAQKKLGKQKRPLALECSYAQIKSLQSSNNK